MTDPRSSFRWSIYADATLAGLSLLLPLPFVDSSTEAFFRRRMVESIAQIHKQTLTDEAIRQLATLQQSKSSLWRAISLWPAKLTVNLAKRVSRKLIYAWTVHQSIDALTDYWRQAYLLDHLMHRLDLSSEATRTQAITALQQTLKENDGSPLVYLAQQLVLSPYHLWQAARNARRGIEDSKLGLIRSIMEKMWGNFSAYFGDLRGEFDRNFVAQATVSPLVTSEQTKETIADLIR